jgi:hypothetical protein
MKEGNRSLAAWTIVSTRGCRRMYVEARRIRQALRH